MAKIDDYTEEKFWEFVRKIFDASGTTEAEDIKNILKFKGLTQPPLMVPILFTFHEKAEKILPRVCRPGIQGMANGKPGFKP